MQYSHILSYIGGKFNIADWIVPHFPKHVCYVEPFGGAARVLLRKRVSEIEVYNDISQDLVNLFMIAKEMPDKLITETNALPYSRWLYETWLKDWKAAFMRSSDPLTGLCLPMRCSLKSLKTVMFT